jgi:hypothetical protein
MLYQTYPSYENLSVTYLHLNSTYKHLNSSSMCFRMHDDCVGRGKAWISHCLSGSSVDTGEAATDTCPHTHSQIKRLAALVQCSGLHVLVGLSCAVVATAACRFFRSLLISGMLVIIAVCRSVHL